MDDLKMTQMSEDEALKPVEKKKPGKVTGLIFAILAFFAFLGSQLICSYAGMGIKSAQILATVDGDMNLYMERYTAAVMDSTFLTNVLVVSEFVSITLGLIWYYFGYVRKEDKNIRKDNRKKVFTFKTFVTCILLAIGFYSIDHIVSSAVAYISPEAEETFSNTMNMVFDTKSLISMLVLTIIGPIAEEVMFRGVVLHALKKSWPKWGAIIISAVLFAGVHLIPMQIIYAMPIAIAMGYVCYRYNSILPTILIHIINNTIAGYIGLIPESILKNLPLFAGIAIIFIGGAVYIQKDNLFKKEA